MWEEIEEGLSVQSVEEYDVEPVIFPVLDIKVKWSMFGVALVQGLKLCVVLYG